MRKYLIAASSAIFVTIFLIGLFTQNMTAQETAVPTAPPDAERGLAIYAERCAVCHGELGAGDGEQAVAAGLEPRNFAEPVYRLEANPQLMFDVITNGSLANGMPPFGAGTSNPLSEADRWHLVAAIYSFSTPEENLELGESLFAGAGGDLTELPDLDYWYTRSNSDVLADLSGGEWGFAVTGMSAADQEAVVDYGRAQTYQYANPLAAFEPIESATISGLIVNGTTTDPETDVEAVLRAFAPDFTETLAMTTTVDSDGRYTFDLTDVPPEWIYLVSTDYEGLTFNSQANQLNRETPELSMPIIVYDATDDVAVVSVNQIHMILSFEPDSVQISELYIFNNEGNAVFAGETGNPDDGTVQIYLPAGAENVNFQRSFGSLENFGPAPEVIQTETGWADTLPLRPGDGSSSLLVSYELPYEDGLRLGHPLVYPVAGATAIMPDVGVELSGDGWQSEGAQALPGGSYLAYVNSGLAGSDALSLELNGRAEQLVDAQGNAVLVRDESQELIVGMAALGLTLLAGVFFVRQWQQPTAVADNNNDKQALLQAIADLDDEFEAGELDEAAYAQEREQLKEELRAIWS